MKILCGRVPPFARHDLDDGCGVGAIGDWDGYGGADHHCVDFLNGASSSHRLEYGDARNDGWGYGRYPIMTLMLDHDETYVVIARDSEHLHSVVAYFSADWLNVSDGELTYLIMEYLETKILSITFEHIFGSRFSVQMSDEDKVALALGALS